MDILGRVIVQLVAVQVLKRQRNKYHKLKGIAHDFEGGHLFSICSAAARCSGSQGLVVRRVARLRASGWGGQGGGGSMMTITIYSLAIDVESPQCPLAAIGGLVASPDHI